MKKYEYLIKEKYTDGISQDELSSLGENGWALAAAPRTENVIYSDDWRNRESVIMIQYIFMREKQ